MKISILDQAPISSGYSPKEALEASVQLAQSAERLGYTRYWIAEHHDLSGFACSAPEIMLSYIGAKTKNIRIGAGAILLPHYKPYKIAESFNMLATLFPGKWIWESEGHQEDQQKRLWHFPKISWKVSAKCRIR